MQTRAKDVLNTQISGLECKHCIWVTVNKLHVIFLVFTKAIDESEAAFSFQTLYILLIFLLKIKEKCKIGANRHKLNEFKEWKEFYS